VQLLTVGVTIGYTALATGAIYKLVDIFIGVRVEEREELMGLDVTQHHERAYTVLE